MKLLAIDGNSLINRAFYGVRTLTSSDGVPTNAVYGFLNMLQKLREDYAPEAICVCFDRREKTFRHEAYPEYKAGRRPSPPELHAQMPLCKEALRLMGIACLEAAGFEADDLLGTLARLCRESGDSCVIATGDRDSLQFIAEGATVSLVITREGQTTTEDYDTAVFMEKYQGLTPGKIIDLKAIMGDSSDNIPGVRGIGEKGAMALLTRFGSLEGVYANLDDPSITQSVRQKLLDGRDMARLSYQLATGELNAPVALPLEQYRLLPLDEGGLYAFLDKLQLRSIIKRMNLSPAAGAAVDAAFAAKAAEAADAGTLLLAARKAGAAALCVSDDLSLCAVTAGEKTFTLLAESSGEAVFLALLEGLTAPDIALTLHNAKPLWRALLARGLSPALPHMDTALAAYLLSPGDSGYEMAAVAGKYLGFDATPAIYNSEDAHNLFGVTPEALAAISEHSQLAAALGARLEAKLAEAGMLALLRDMELPLMAELAAMERCGMAVDKSALLAFGDSLSGDMDRLEQEIYDHAGEKFNIGSPKQMGVILFEKLGLKAMKKTKTGYSTDADVLEKLRAAHPIVAAILDWRKLSKLKSTYVEGLSKVIGPDGRIHSTFHQDVTATGRLSSSEPNLQNIPIRTQLGGEIRRFFVAPEGAVLVDADYSQIELRILAHIAEDTLMLEAFRSGEDVHSVTASQVFGVVLSDVTSEMRRRAKAVNFGIVYGISAFSLADDIGVTVKEAQAYMDAYLEKYTGVRDYMAAVRKQAHEDGFVTTLYGRRRMLPELKSGNFNTRAFGERVALNTPIQGTAADIIKLAMLGVARRLRAEGLRSRLILQVHDELIIEATLDEREAVSMLLKEEMEKAAHLSVSLTAEVSWGENWYAAKK